ncbi:cytochrome P450 [Lentzea pudingi]
MTNVEARAVLAQLLIAGNETTTNFLGNLVHLLLSRPDLHRGDLSAVVEEGLRLVGPVKGLLRRATRDTEVGGCPVARDARLLVLFASANRDEAVSAAADEFVPDRPELRRSLAFGRGVHFCAGAALARMEVRMALKVPFGALPRLRLHDVRRAIRTGEFHYGLTSLPVAWRAENC